jgi:hypothetical protein
MHICGVFTELCEVYRCKYFQQLLKLSTMACLRISPQQRATRCRDPIDSSITARPPHYLQGWLLVAGSNTYRTRTLLKIVRDILVPGRDVTNQTLPGRYLFNFFFGEGIFKLFPASESLVGDIPTGDGKIVNLFLQCTYLPASLPRD